MTIIHRWRYTREDVRLCLVVFLMNLVIKETILYKYESTRHFHFKLHIFILRCPYRRVSYSVCQCLTNVRVRLGIVFATVKIGLKYYLLLVRIRQVRNQADNRLYRHSSTSCRLITEGQRTHNLLESRQDCLRL